MNLIFTDYYIGEKDLATKTRYDVISSTKSHDYLERVMINKKEPNKGGLSFYLVDRPGHWGGRWERKTDKAITKGPINLTSIVVPDPIFLIGHGDLINTSDAVIFRFTEDEDGDLPIGMYRYLEMFIARGQKNNQLNLYQLVMDGEYDEEMEILRLKSRELK